MSSKKNADNKASGTIPKKQAATAAKPLSGAEIIGVQVPVRVMSSDNPRSAGEIQAAARASAGATFPNWETWADMLAFTHQFINPQDLNTRHTKLPTMFDRCLPITNYLNQLNGLKGDGARSAVVAKYLESTLQGLTPYYHVIWLFNTNVWRAAEKYFNSDSAQAIINLFKISKDVNECPLQDVKTYVDSCKEFRDVTAQYLSGVNPAFDQPRDAVPMRVEVNRAVLSALTIMLQSIITKRNKALGSSERASSGAPSHYEDFLDFLMTGEHMGITPLDARRARGQGLEADGTPFMAQVGGKEGALLLTTAVLYHRQVRGDPEFLPETPSDDRGKMILAACFRELHAIEEGRDMKFEYLKTRLTH